MTVRFGMHIPNGLEGLFYQPPFANAQENVDLAVEAEELGYYSVWVNDHITTQNYLSHLDPKPNFFEPLMVLGACAVRTEKIKLCTGIIALPLRNPVILAKQVATLDRMSDGRVILGVGAGAYREEFEAMHPDLSTKVRPAMINESIQAMKALFGKEAASFDGEVIKFGTIELNPKPVQDPLPIYAGGNAKAVTQRAGRYADGWFPAAVPLEALAEGRQRIAQEAAAAGREQTDLPVALEILICMDESHEKAVAKFRGSLAYEHLVSLADSTLRDQKAESFEQNNLVGTPEEIAAKLRSYADAGIDHIVLIWVADTVADFRQQMVTFSKSVMPQFA